jgi:hypothetical protein
MISVAQHCMRASLETRVYSQLVVQLVSFPDVSNITAIPWPMQTVRAVTVGPHVQRALTVPLDMSIKPPFVE